MSRDSFKDLYRKDYCKEVEIFINLNFLIQRILVGVKLDVHV